MARRQVLNCSRLHCWPEEWRPDPRGFLLPPFLVDFPSWRLHTKSIHSETQNPLFLLHLLKYHSGEKKNGAIFGAASLSSSRQLLYNTALLCDFLTSWKGKQGLETGKLETRAPLHRANPAFSLGLLEEAQMWVPERFYAVLFFH